MLEIPITISFLVTFLVLPLWIKRARKFGFVEKDVHKKSGKAAGLGGLIVGFGFIAGLMSYVALEVFYFKNGSNIILVIATSASVLTAIIIGLVDDLLGWKIGLGKIQKLMLPFLIAVPIMVINAGVSEITIPFFGRINILWLYPLVVVPIGISGAANGFNIIAGYNGLEAGMGVLILICQGVMVFSTHNYAVAVMAFCMAASLLAFLFYNYYPAKIFPGDTMTYSVGALIAIVAILGNIEKFSVFLFGLYFIEGLLKARGKLKKESFAKLLPDGSLAEPYSKYYGIEHIAITIVRKIKNKCYEKDVVFFVWVLQFLIALCVLLDFFVFKF